LISERAMDAATISVWMNEAAAAMRAERDHLVQLDAAIGDGDHGINMTRGFDAVVQALEAEAAAPGKMLITAGKTLVSSVGGASGPLWGSALRRAGRALGEDEAFGADRLVEALEDGLAAVKDLGQAQPGDKTMVDALEPALIALKKAVQGGKAVSVATGEAAAAAEEGMRATIPMQARRGRASYLGERSVGHQDPGATSAALIMRALERAVAAEG
jgi:dihydroxyacetone kinase-like protein